MHTTIDNMSFDDVTYWINYVLDNPEAFLTNAEYYARGVGIAHILRKMLDVVTAANNEESFNDPPGEYEIKDLIYLFSVLPFLILQDKNENTWTISLAIVLLTYNYSTIYPNELLQQAVETTFMLFQTYNHMTILLGACDNLLNRCERWENSQVDLYGICDAFKERLLYAETQKEKANASTSDSE